MSHFPTLEDFEEGKQTVTRTVDADSGVSAASAIDLVDDPAADFLFREKTTLGADADIFASQGDGILGATDVYEGAAVGVAVGAAAVAADATTFQSAFPDINIGNAAVGPGGTITGSDQPYLPGSSYSMSSNNCEEEEPEVVKQWRERRELEIQRRDELSEQRKREMIEKAQQAIDDFYENYNSKRDKAIEETRREEKEFMDLRENTVAGGTAWERIAKLVDLSDKKARSGSDKTRFREILLSLRKDEKAPGASGF